MFCYPTKGQLLGHDLIFRICGFCRLYKLDLRGNKLPLIISGVKLLFWDMMRTFYNPVKIET